MKPVVFYHKSCADGFGAAYAAWKYLDEDADFVPVGYGDIKSLLDVDLLGPIMGRVVYILDFSFPREVMDYIDTHALHMVWIDHHKTAFEMWLPNEPFTDNSSFTDYDDKRTIILDNRNSGAMLTWMYFAGHTRGESPMLFKYIDDYDRWQFKLEGTKPFSKGLWSTTPWTFEQWDKLDAEALVETGETLLRDHTARVSKHVEHSRMCSINGRMGLAINAPGYVSSDAGHELAVASGTYGMTYHIDDKLVVKGSLRSNGDYDVSVLAKTLGGGGHKSASGFECSIDQLLQLLAA